MTQPAALSKPETDISPRSELFPVLRRIQTRADSLFPSQSFPQKEGRLEAWSAGDALTPADRYWLDMRLPGRRAELLTWASPGRGNSLYLSPEFETGFTAGSRGDSSLDARLGGFGLAAYGRLATRMAYYARGLVYTEMTGRKQFSHQFNPDMGETYSVEKGEGDSLLADRTFNRHTFYATYDLPWITFKAGRDHVHTGPGYFSSLTAGSETPPYYMIEARIDFAPWLQMDNYILRMTDTDHAIRKYANLHRFEFRPHPTLSLAFQDIVIYQDRDADPRYLLPLVPLTFTESENGGMDNSAMGFDFLWRAARHVSLWGELFIDDLLGPSAFFDDFWENRWAGLAGLQVTSPLPGFDADVVAEYGQVEPWTYIGREPQTSFKHFNVPSASKLGPDSRSLDLQAAYRPWRGLELKVRWEANDKGQGRQATLGVVHDDSIDPKTKDLLGGAVRSERILTPEASLLYGQYLLARLSWSHDFGDGTADAVRGTIRLSW
jgi:hypothetical protein